jgi:hypothetical protein
LLQIRNGAVTNSSLTSQTQTDKAELKNAVLGNKETITSIIAYLKQQETPMDTSVENLMDLG